MRKPAPLDRKGAAPNAKRLQNGVATGCRFEFFAGSNGLKRKVEPALAAQPSRGAESAPQKSPHPEGIYLPAKLCAIPAARGT